MDSSADSALSERSAKGTDLPMATSKQPHPDDGNVASEEIENEVPRSDGDASGDGCSHAPPVAISKLAFLMVMIALTLSIFCVALDNVIIATAIPRITDDFKTLNDVGWYGSAYLLPTAALQLTFGKVYTFFHRKWTFMVCLAVFEIGSLVSATAPTSPAFIGGRAVSGIGAAGLFSGALIIIATLTPLDKRPAYQSIIAATYAVATVLGPLIGGAFTDGIGWRWCFYVNLPIGGLSALLLFLFLRLPSVEMPKITPGFLWRFDPLGTILFVGGVVCVLLALQLGGTSYPWGSGRIIALFVVAGVLLIAFVVVQVWMGDNATLPPRIAKQRTVASATVFAFLACGQQFTLIYFIPIYFQAIKGVDAERSGIDSIPLILSSNLAGLLQGALCTIFLHYLPFFYAGALLTSVGAGLISTWQVGTASSFWIGTQILEGFGNGLSFQVPQVAAQAALPPEDIPVGIAMTLFGLFFGGAVFISVGNTILSTRLIHNIAERNISSVDVSSIISLGATGIRRVVSPEELPMVLDAYMDALRWVFRAALILCCLQILPTLTMEWRKIPKPPKPADSTEEAEKTVGEAQAGG